MKRRSKSIATVVFALAIFASAAGEAVAAPPIPSGLTVGPGEGWVPTTRFQLRWDAPAAGSGVGAVGYRVRNPLGAIVVGPVESNPILHATEVSVPWVQGAYTAEVWFEDAFGQEGTPATAKLRFDDTRPGSVSPAEASGWIGRAELPHTVEIGHPAAPLPLSGIRGYAVSIDDRPGSSPCAEETRCTEAEIDLHAGIADDELIVPELPEGTSYVHAVAVSGSGMRSPAVGSAALRVDRTDPVTRLEGAPQGWVDHSVVLRATAADSASGMGEGEGGNPFTAIRVDGEPPTVVSGDSAATAVGADGVHRVAYYARDAAGNADDGKLSNGHLDAAPREALVRIDREPPVVTLIGSSGPADPELILARVGDRLSGPASGRGTIGLRPLGSNQPFQPLPTWTDGDSLLARWPSDEFAPGEYEFRATGYDSAGNAANGDLRANGTPLVLPSPLKVAASLTATISAGSGKAIGFGARPLLAGRLALASGEAASGATVTIVESFDPGSPLRRRVSTAPTDAEGRYAATLEPGPSRTVTVNYDGSARAAAARSRSLRLGVRPKVALAVSASVAAIGGPPVVFRGRVDARPGDVPPDGVAVELQFKVPGGDWSEFRTVRTDRRGRFRYRYRFSDDDSSGVRFRFRASAPTQSDWPYEPGGSRPVAVRGA